MSLCMKRSHLTSQVVLALQARSCCLQNNLILFLCLLKLLGNLGGPPNSQQVKNSDIWNEEDIPEGGHGEDEHDPRPAPE